jgi:hypothetical protein
MPQDKQFEMDYLFTLACNYATINVTLLGQSTLIWTCSNISCSDEDVFNII